MGYFDALFYFFQFAILSCSLLAVYSSNSVYSILYLILVFCNVSGLLILIDADFLAMVIVVIYIGAIAVLFLFVVMMINIRETGSFLNFSFYISNLIILCTVIIELNLIFYKGGLDFYKFIDLLYREDNIAYLPIFYAESYTHYVGYLIFIHNPEVLILASIILLISMIGVIILTLTYKINLKRQFIFEQNLRSDFIKLYQ